jgi:PhnB protein
MTSYKPDGYIAVTAWLISADTAGLIDFIIKAFGGVELARMVSADGRIGHAEVRIGDAVVMLFDKPEGWPATPAFLRLYVPDADKAHRDALAAGASSVTAVTHLAFGDRVGRVKDPAGNIWWLQTHVEDVDETEMNRRWSDPKWAAAMDYVEKSLADQRLD